MALFNKIIYVRHGESQLNKFFCGNNSERGNATSIRSIADPCLTDLGKIQAEMVGDHLVNKTLEKQINGLKFSKVLVMVSPYDRAMNTSMPYLTKILEREDVELDVRILPDLCELTLPHKILNDDLKNKGIIHDNSWKSFVSRVKLFNKRLKSIIETQDSDKVLTIIFGHSLFFSVLLSIQGSQELFNGELSQIAFELPNCSISSVGYSKIKKIWAIYHVASITHLSRDVITGNHVTFDQV